MTIERVPVCIQMAIGHLVWVVVFGHKQCPIGLKINPNKTLVSVRNVLQGDNHTTRRTWEQYWTTRRVFAQMVRSTYSPTIRAFLPIFNIANGQYNTRSVGSRDQHHRPPARIVIQLKDQVMAVKYDHHDFAVLEPSHFLGKIVMLITALCEADQATDIGLHL